MNKPYSIDFRAPETASELSSYIGLDAKLFKKVISSATRREFYQAERIVKRSPHRENKFRDIWNVKYSILAEAHKTITRRFELFARLADPRFPHESAYGYIRNRGTRENAKVHCGAPLLLRADLRNFFPSISIDRLRKRFLELGMQSEAAFALAKFVTVDDVLPLGLNASPMLANLVCVDLDIKLQKLAQAYGCKATRYADDISISGKRSLPSRAELEKIIESEGFQLSNEKFRVTKLGQAHYVTGLSISDENIPHAPRNMKRRLRQELYYCKKYGIPNHLGRLGYDYIQGGINRIDGTVHYVSHIETENSEKIKSLWNALLEKDHVEASYDTRIDTEGEPVRVDRVVPAAEEAADGLGFGIMEVGRDVQVGVVVGHPDLRFLGGGSPVNGIGHDEVARGRAPPDIFLKDTVDLHGLRCPHGAHDLLFLRDRRLLVLFIAGGEYARKDHHERPNGCFPHQSSPCGFMFIHSSSAIQKRGARRPLP